MRTKSTETKNTEVMVHLNDSPNGLLFAAPINKSVMQSIQSVATHTKGNALYAHTCDMLAVAKGQPNPHSLDIVLNKVVKVYQGLVMDYMKSALKGMAFKFTENNTLLKFVIEELKHNNLLVRSYWFEVSAEGEVEVTYEEYIAVADGYKLIRVGEVDGDSEELTVSQSNSETVEEYDEIEELTEE